ncbi:MAG TPA: PQQ-binding-like beta-propeller repeat protein [Thermoanaerobaculia bacterium]|nr:PQQ-binding-like beta-propeller repeat protein [Thermoanaerobaculia bacterium]
MTTSQTVSSTGRRPLRLWPGVLIVALQWFTWLGLARLASGTSLGMWAFIGGVGLGTLGVLVWWAFFSRAPHLERWGAILLAVLAVIGTYRLLDPSVSGAGMGKMFYFYVLPTLCLALVIGAAAGRRLTPGPRRLVLAVAILIGCGLWTLFRSDGVMGGGDPQFGWRWTPSAEERLLAQGKLEPVAPPASPAPTAAPVEAAPASAGEGTPAIVPSATTTSATEEAEDAPEPAPPVNPTSGATSPTEPVAAERAAVEPSPAAPLTEPVAATAADGPATLALNLAAPASDGEWPGFRGPSRDGIVRGVRIDPDWVASPPRELWRRPVGPAWSSFAVRGDRIYTQEQRGEEELVTCYNATTGEPIWVHRDAARFWEANAGAGPRATPTLHAGRVYTLGGTGIANALDADTGAVVWTRNAAADTGAATPYWGFSGSPLVVGDLAVVPTGGRLAAYDLASGEVRWLGSTGKGGYSSPQLVRLGGVPQILMRSGEGLASFAPADGKLLWQYEWAGASLIQPALTPEGDVLLASSDSAGGTGTRRVALAHDGAGWRAEERWTTMGLKPYFNDLVVHRGHAYGFDGRILSAIDLADGQRKWKGGRYGHGQMLLLPEQDLILVQAEDGDVALVKASPEGFTEIARVPAIQGKTWNHPVLVGDLLLVRNSEEMAAFRLAVGGR